MGGGVVGTFLFLLKIALQIQQLLCYNNVSNGVVNKCGVV